MSLRFIFGRAGSGKSTYCLNKIKEKMKSGFKAPLVLLVPEQFSFQAEKSLLDYAGEKVFAYVQVLSFNWMAYKVFSEEGGIARNHINPAGKNMLIYDVLDETESDLTLYKSASHRQGFIDVMNDMITEFKRYNVTPEMLKDASKNIKDGGLKDKINELQIIYENFEKKLHERYIDAEDDLTLLSEKLDTSDIYRGAEIWIDQFISFTPQQYVIIEKLLKKAARVNITLTADCIDGCENVDSTDVFMPVKNTEKELLKIISDNNVAYEKPVCMSSDFRFRGSRELQHLERYLFSYPYVSYKEKTQDISIFKSINMYSEIEDTARHILKLVRDGGLKYSEIVVAAGNLESYDKLIEVIFKEFGIPYFIDERRNIENNPLIIMLSSMIEIFTKNWSYEAVFRYLKSGLVNVDREDIDKIENYVLKNGIKGDRWLKEWEDKDIDNIRAKVTEPLLKFENEVKDEKSAENICRSLYEFSESINVPGKIKEWIDKFRDEGDQDSADQYDKIWDIFIELLDQIVEVINGEEITLDKFIKVLKTGIDKYDIGLIPPALDQVLVGSVSRLKDHNISAIFLIGVNDGVFPSPMLDEGILSDDDRENLKNVGIEIAEDTKSLAFEEQFLIYTIFSSASKYLRISFPIADMEGKTLRPSFIISRLKKIFPDIKEDSNLIKKGTDEENLSLVSSPAATFNELLNALRKSYPEAFEEPVWKDVYVWFKNNDKWKEKIKRAFEGFSYSNQVPYVSRNKVNKLYGTPLYLSVSRLEKYAECPFAYYVQYGLKAKERDIYEFTAPDIGSFMHEALNEFSESADENNIDFKTVDEKWCKSTISKIVDNIMEDKSSKILKSSKRYAFIGSRLKSILQKSVWVITEQFKSGKFKMAGHEVEFSDKGEFPPIKFRLPSGDVINFTGRIDRLDEVQEEDGKYIRIIDYKSGNKSFKLSDVYYGLELQLLVYLDAVLSNEEKYKKENVLPGAIFYFRLDDPFIASSGEINGDDIKKEILKKFKFKGLVLGDVKIVKDMDENINGYSLIIPARLNKNGTLGNSSSLSMEQFNTLRKYVRKIVIDLSKELLSGNISINPCKNKNFTPCSYCSYLSICGFDVNIKGNRFKVLEDKKDEEVLSIMEKEVKDDDKVD